MCLFFKMPENKRKNAFRGKQTSNQVPSNIFRCLEDGKMARLMFLSPNHSIKNRWNVFNGWKQRAALSCCIYSVNCNKIFPTNVIKS